MSLRSIFPSVSADERPRLLFAVAAFACVAAAGVVARTAGGALFLSAYPPASLAPMYVLSAVILMAVAFGVGWAVTRVPFSRLLPAVAIGLVAATLLLRVSLTTESRFPAAAVYLFSDLVAKVPPLLFWSAAASMFDPRQAKRLFVLVGAAGTAACVVAGVLIGPFTSVLGTANLLLALAVLLGAFGLVTRNCMRAFDAPQASPGRDARPARGLRYYGELLAIPQLRHIAAIAVLGALALLLTDFLFKSARL